MECITFEDMEWLLEEAKLDAEHYDMSDVAEVYWKRFFDMERAMYEFFYHQEGVETLVATKVLIENGLETVVEEWTRRCKGVENVNG